MGTTISARPTDDLLTWMDTQPESRSALIILALQALRDSRSRGGPDNPPVAPSSPIDTPQLVTALLEALRGAAPELGRAIGKSVASQLAASAPVIYANEQPALEPEPTPIDAEALYDDIMAGLESLEYRGT